MSEENNKLQKVESAVNIGGIALSAALVVIQIVGLFRGRPTKI